METRVNPVYLKNFPHVLQLVIMIRQCTLRGVQQMVVVMLQTLTYFKQTVSTSHSAACVLPLSFMRMAPAASDSSVNQKKNLNAKPSKGHNQPASILDLQRGALMVPAGWFTSNEPWEVSEVELLPARYTIHSDQMRILNFNGHSAIPPEVCYLSEQLTETQGPHPL